MHVALWLLLELVGGSPWTLKYALFTDLVGCRHVPHYNARKESSEGETLTPALHTTRIMWRRFLVKKHSLLLLLMFMTWLGIRAFIVERLCQMLTSSSGCDRCVASCKLLTVQLCLKCKHQTKKKKVLFSLKEKVENLYTCRYVGRCSGV